MSEERVREIVREEVKQCVAWGRRRDTGMPFVGYHIMNYDELRRLADLIKLSKSTLSTNPEGE